MRAREEGKIAEREDPRLPTRALNMVEQPIEISPCCQETVALGSGALNHFVPRIIVSVLLGEEQPEGRIFSRDRERHGGGAPGPEARQASIPILVLNVLVHVT